MNKALAIVTGVLAVIVVSQYFGSQRELVTAKNEYVYHICWAAHNEVSGQSEQECGDAQDRTHTEFLCDRTGTHCWVENK